MTDPNLDPGDKLRRAEERIRHPGGMLKQIGALMVAESQQAFTSQAFGPTKWKARSVPNVFGIIADLTVGKEPPARRFSARPALRDTGRLASSVTFRVDGSEVLVGSNLPYAAVHNYGGAVESEKITATVQEALAKFLRGSGKPWRKKLGWILNAKYLGRKLAREVPARKFVGITEETIEDVREVVGVGISQNAKGAN